MEPVRVNELGAFFAYVVRVLESVNIPYMVVGGFAAIFYGEPRLTLDVDIVVDMRLSQVRAFVAAFPIPDYYARDQAIRDALQRRYPFNVIQPTTGAKVDLIPLPREPYMRAAFERRQRMEFDAAGHSAMFIIPEDIVVAKLVAFRETGSDKHIRDARGVLVAQWGQLDLDIIRHRAHVAGVGEQFEQVLDIAKTDIAG